MTPEQHAKAIEDAAEQYAYAYSIDDFKDRSKAFDVLQDAIWAGVRVDHSVDANKMVAAPEGGSLCSQPARHKSARARHVTRPQTTG